MWQNPSVTILLERVKNSLCLHFDIVMGFTGKLIHSGADQLSGSDYSLVDYNRAGVPLLEVVSEPDMRSGAEAAAYASELRRIMLFMGLTEGIMAEGHLRFDVNISVTPFFSAASSGAHM